MIKFKTIFLHNKFRMNRASQSDNKKNVTFAKNESVILNITVKMSKKNR